MTDEQYYPPLLTAKHISNICSCHITTAYEIMRESHRPRWQHGKKVRLLRDEFLLQLKEEAQNQRGA